MIIIVYSVWLNYIMQDMKGKKKTNKHRKIVFKKMLSYKNCGPGCLQCIHILITTGNI